MSLLSNPPNSIGSELSLFIRHIESLEEIMPITLLALNSTKKSALKTYNEFVQKNSIVAKNKEQIRINIPAANFRKYFKVKARYDNLGLAETLVPRSIFVTLVSQYDAYLGRLIRSILLSKPELLKPSEKTITFAEATSFPSIEAIRDHVIEKEVEGVLRSSHLDHFKWMEKRFGIPLTKDLAILPQFIELTERRNLFVHADGLISSNYLRVCKNNGVNLKSLEKEGFKLTVSQHYFEESASCLLVLGVMLGHVLWRHLLPSERENADKNLLETAYGLIDKGNDSEAIQLLDFACNSIKTYHGDWYKMAIILNRAQAYKWSGNIAKCSEILDAHDWSALEDSLKIGNDVLRGNWQAAAAIMRRIGNEGSIKKMDYEDWPIFREFRSTPDFLSTYQEIFGHEFSIELSSLNTTQDRPS